MKKISLMLIASSVGIASIAQEATKKENIFEIHAKGGANSTWLFNNNISNTGDSQNYAPGYGFNYGLGFNAYFGMIGVGIEGLMGNHVGAYAGKIETKVGGVVLKTTDYTSSVNLKMIQVPLLFKLRAKGGAFLELGAQYNMISSADYSRKGENMNADTTVTNMYASSFYSGVLGFGLPIKLGESPLSLVIGLRLQYSLTDLKGVDALGQDLNNAFIYNKYESTAAAAGGLSFGIIYRLNKKKS
jgi:hypothetical protein